MTDTSLRIDETTARDRFEAALAAHSQTFEQFFLARFMDLSFDYLPQSAADEDKETCRITFPMTDMLRNPQGALHGGIMASVMDISMGHLIAKTSGPGATIELKIQYLRPVTQGTITCEGRFTKRGRNISFMESRITDESGKLAALATATWKMP